MSPGPVDTIRRLHRAMNDHDIDAFVECFHEDYDSQQPAHPARAFHGREQLRHNWSGMFGAIKDFHGDVVRLTADGSEVWTEWRWTGTRPDGLQLEMWGTTIFGVEDDRISWGRLYMEPVEEEGAGMDAAVEDATGTGRD
jgi:limonene-1,2-epoxide hydrolase